MREFFVGERMRSSLAVVFAVLLTLFGPAVPPAEGADVTPAAAIDAAARRVWATWPSRGDPEHLDAYLRLYGESAPGQVVFSYRFALLEMSWGPQTLTRTELLTKALAVPRGSEAAEDKKVVGKALQCVEAGVRAYEMFLAAHPDRLAAFAAVQDLYELQDLAARLSGSPQPYAKFMQTCPGSPQALLAKAKAEVMLFQEVCRVNSVSAYQDFIESYPDAPQSQTAIMLSTSAMKREEEEAVADLKRVAKSKDVLYQALADRLRPYQVAYRASLSSLFDIRRNQMLDEATKRQALIPLLAVSYRLRNAIYLGVYKEHAKLDPRVEEMWNKMADTAEHEESLKVLEEIRVAVEKTHAGLAGLLEREFAATRNVLKDGFAQLSRDIKDSSQVIAAGLDKVAAKVEQVKTGLDDTNRLLTKTISKLEDVDTSIREVNNGLKRIESGLVDVRNEIRGVSVELGNKLGAVAVEIGDLKKEVGRGFARQEAVQREVLAALENQSAPDFLSLGGAWRAASAAAGRATTWTKKQGGHLASGTKEFGAKIDKAGRKLFGMLLPGKVYAYCFEGEGRFSINLRTGSYDTAFELIPGVKAHDLKLSPAAFKDGLPIDVNPVRALGSSIVAGCKTSSDFVAVRDATLADYPDDLVYFCSERFAEWAGPEHLAGDAALAVLSGGALFEEILKKYQKYFLLELEDIRAWLEVVANAQAEAFLADALTQLFGGPGVGVNGLSVHIVPKTVTYRYEFFVRTPPFLPLDVVRDVTGVSADLLKAKAAEDVKHSAFAIRIKGLGKRKDLLSDIRSRFDERRRAGLKPMTKELYAKLLGKVGGKAVKALNAMDYASFAADHVRQEVASAVAQKLGVRQATLEEFAAGNVVLDLTTHPVAERVRGHLKAFAQGNERDARIDRVELNLATGG